MISTTPSPQTSDQETPFASFYSFFDTVKVRVVPKIISWAAVTEARRATKGTVSQSLVTVTTLVASVLTEEPFMYFIAMVLLPTYETRSREAIVV